MATTKKSWERMHARQRAKERFGISLSNKDLATIIKMIQRGEGEFLHSRSQRTSMWRIRYANKTMVAVYDKDRKMIVTFLGRGKKKNETNLGLPEKPAPSQGN